MRDAAASLLPLTFAVLLGFAGCRPDSAARLEPESGGAARPRSRGAALGVADTAHSLSPAPRPPPPARPLPAAFHVDRGSTAAAGSGGDGRRQRPDRGLPASRGQAGDAGLSPGPGQRSRLDPSRQRQGGGLKAQVVPRAKEPSRRGRMSG